MAASLLNPARLTTIRFRRQIALLITLASVLAAFAAWRAEDRARFAEESDRDGYAQQADRQEQITGIRSDILDAVRTYAQAQNDLALAAGLRAAEANHLSIRNDLADLATAYELRGRDRLDSVPADARDASGAVTVDSANRQKLDRAIAFRQTEADIDPAPEFRASNSDFSRSDDDVGIAVLALGSAFIFTLAQVSRTRTAFAFVGAGIGLLVTAVVLLLVIELA